MKAGFTGGLWTYNSSVILKSSLDQFVEVYGVATDLGFDEVSASS